jgi:preprotein translocase subunit SecD
VQSAPEVNGALTTGQFEIAGPQPNGFTEAQAKALAAQL